MNVASTEPTPTPPLTLPLDADPSPGPDPTPGPGPTPRPGSALDSDLAPGPAPTLDSDPAPGSAPAPGATSAPGSTPAPGSGPAPGPAPAFGTASDAVSGSGLGPARGAVPASGSGPGFGSASGHDSGSGPGSSPASGPGPVPVHAPGTASGAAPGSGDRLPPSSLYAAAALRAGASYANFTPSTGLHHPALAALAADAGLPFAGRDGKTGQTLLRSVLGPMFAQRALAVRAWSGTNLLGGGDGAALADPAAAAAKNAGKERVLADTLGTVPEGEVHIDDVPALGDWKTAWDHIAFDGFLGTRMTLQTTWQGCDSALAAPLILDLARLLARAHETGLTGPRPELAFYFKDPDPGASSALPDQHLALLAFAARLREQGVEA
ncbi:hypothetical protein AT728_32330 [Streptomyces silvensis]|uniref:Myo-inositol-1-phosphate synthase GAPDH-like domain-containing protein n=1 Tax=Streptomyces silvensis TaxID=1765722 RepID=A0A0W7WVN2_9ACTN|nr:hypothetical protein AT728_32330 [Streptomyces silvensis]